MLPLRPRLLRCPNCRQSFATDFQASACIRKAIKTHSPVSCPHCSTVAQYPASADWLFTIGLVIGVGGSIAAYNLNWAWVLNERDTVLTLASLGTLLTTTGALKRRLTVKPL